jgi:hypothetical protein
MSDELISVGRFCEAAKDKRRLAESAYKAF